MSKDRVLRGGSFNYDSWNLRTSSRVRHEPEGRLRVDGFRIVVIGRRSP